MRKSALRIRMTITSLTYSTFALRRFRACAVPGECVTFGREYLVSSLIVVGDTMTDVECDLQFRLNVGAAAGQLPVPF